MGDDEVPPVDVRLDSLAQRFEKDGVDTRFLEEPFLEAAELGDASTLKRRLDELSPDERRRFVRSVDQQGRTGLLLAVRSGDEDVAQVLLDAGANPNDTDCGGVTALHLAATRGTAVALLLHCCAEVGRRDDQGETPLMWACPAAIRPLLEARADAHEKSSDGRTALAFASSKGDLVAVEMLAALPGTDLDALDSHGVSPHAAALAAGHIDVSDLLLRLGAAPSAVASPPRVARADEALHEAVRRGDAGCVALQAAGVSPDVEVAGETPLLLAASAGSGRVVEVLLQARADPNLGDRYLHETPLMRAVLASCSNELLWLLLEARADPLKADLAGRIPAEVAASWGNKDGAELLRAAASGNLFLGEMD